MEDVTLTVEATDADAPMAKLSFGAEAVDMVASALKERVGLRATVSMGALVAGDAERFAVACYILTTRRYRCLVVGVPAPATSLVVQR